MHCGADVACARVAAEMYVKAHPHEAAASQPLFSRAVQPAQRSSPMSDRRKRKAPAALGREQGPQVRRTQKHARVCVLSEPPAHVRVAKAPAGPYHTLHRCVDVRTRDVFFYPEYTGPAGEEKLHAVQWPTVIELPSTPARSGVDAMSSDGCATTDATEASCSDSHAEITPEPETRCQGISEAGVAAVPPPTLMERRRRKALSPLRLDIIPPFRRRNTNQICVLEAPATHVRLHAVQAGPHHMMHQCIDAHTEEVFFLPEYVGPSGQQSLHRVSWPQTISTAPKAPEHEQDVSFDESLDCAGRDADEIQAGAAENKGEAGSFALLSAASAYSPCSTSSTSTCFTSSADSFCAESTRKIVTCPAPCPAPATNFSKQEFVGGGAGKRGMVDAANGSVLTAIMRGGSPGTPCDVAVATASLAARAVTVN